MPRLCPSLTATFCRLTILLAVTIGPLKQAMTSWTKPWLWSSAKRYGLAFVVTALFLVLRGVLDPTIGNFIPYLAVLPAVIFSASYCGLGPSLMATVLAFFGEQYWFIPPIHSVRIVGEGESAGSIVYFAVCLTVIVLSETKRRAMVRLAVTTEKLQRAGEELGRSHDEL